MRLIYVHLGKEMPIHLLKNLERSIRLFPEISLVVIVNNLKNMGVLPHPNIEYFFYQKTKNYYVNEINSKLDSDFRKGFWIYSLMRLDAIVCYIDESSPGPMIHSESDVIFMPNFPWSKMQELNQIAWTRYNNQSDSAALIYFPDKLNTDRFGHLLKDLLGQRSKATDMSILSEISHSQVNSFKILPSLESVSSDLVNPFYPKLYNDIEKMQENFNHFGGLFDAAAFGMWLTGQDPRNNFGYTKIMANSNLKNGDSLIDPSRASYKISDQNLYIEVAGIQIPIWNLHIHSKNTKLFDMFWESELKNFVEKANLGKPYQKFEYKVLYEVLSDNRNQKTLIRFVLNLPFLTPIKNFLKKYLK